jgi:hypothetical protein
MVRDGEKRGEGKRTKLECKAIRKARAKRAEVTSVTQI